MGELTGNAFSLGAFCVTQRETLTIPVLLLTTSESVYYSPHLGTGPITLVFSLFSIGFHLEEEIYIISNG